MKTDSKPLLQKDEAALSDSQYIAAWKHFAGLLPNGDFARLEGVTVISGGVPLPDFNLVVPAMPVAGKWDLEDRVERGAVWISAKKLPWMLVLNLTQLPVALHPDFSTPGSASAAGQDGGECFDLKDWKLPRFDRVRHETGMIAGRPIGRATSAHGLAFRRVADSLTRKALVEVNFRAYGEPPPPGLHGLDDPRVWNESAFALVGYIGSEPVTSGAVFLLEGCFYVGWVATVPGHTRRGFAGIVMREALAGASEIHGWRRSVLHASAAGLSLYTRMGYRAVSEYALCSVRA